MSSAGRSDQSIASRNYDGTFRRITAAHVKAAALTTSVSVSGATSQKVRTLTGEAKPVHRSREPNPSKPKLMPTATLSRRFCTSSGSAPSWYTP